MDISDNYQNSPNSSDIYTEPSSMPLHLYLLLLLLIVPITLAGYMSFESAMESMMDQLRVIVVISPFVLLLAIHWLVDLDSNGRRWWVPFLIPAPERESFHRAGGSPWGVGLVLVLLMFLISNQSYFHDIWFPILNR